MFNIPYCEKFMGTYQRYITEDGKVVVSFQRKRTKSNFWMVYNTVTGEVDYRNIREPYFAYAHEAGYPAWRF